MSYIKTFSVTKGIYFSMRLRKTGKEYFLVLENGDICVIDGSYTKVEQLYFDLEYELARYNKRITVQPFIKQLNQDELKSETVYNLDIGVFSIL